MVFAENRLNGWAGGVVDFKPALGMRAAGVREPSNRLMGNGWILRAGEWMRVSSSSGREASFRALHWSGSDAGGAAERSGARRV
jgi:hypothetical protein